MFDYLKTSPGDYVYLGSGRGTGGTAKRVARDLRAEKKFSGMRTIWQRRSKSEVWALAKIFLSEF